MALEQSGLFKKGKSGGIKTSLWIECLRNTNTAESIETNLGLTYRSFKKGRKEERRKENLVLAPYCRAYPLARVIYRAAQNLK